MVDTHVFDASPDAIAVTHRAYIGIYRGAHVFAAACSEAQANAACARFQAASAQNVPHVFVDGRAALGMCGDEGETELLCSGLGILHWQQANRFCPSCGGPTTLRPDGFKQFCASETCSRRGSPKSIYPSIQPVVISAVLSFDRKRLLLGRKKEWPKCRYSCLAGFIEAGEAVEAAAKREVHEESGVLLSSVAICSSQAWPFPGQLMVGCIGIAAADGDNILQHDEELEDVRWFEMSDVATAVRHTLSSAAPREEADFTLPPKFTIAFQLLKVGRCNTSAILRDVPLVTSISGCM
jgi:NADH pyrophosphatase NudC (nudix superfamily)